VEKDVEKIAHTAEHAFIGALQKILGRTLSVRKVEHKKDGNTAFIVIPQLDIDTVVRAENMVNALIAEGRDVLTRTYPSLEEARKVSPALRANEERISGQVRVVEIAGHDVTACAMEHAANLRECDFFLVTRMSKSGGEYEVDFVVGRQAKETAILFSTKVMKVCEELGANPNTLESTARKVKSEGESHLRKLRALTKEKLQAIEPQVGKVKIYKGSFANLADEQIVEFAGEKIAEPNTVVVIANAGAQNAYFVFARSENVDMDCNKVFRDIAGPDGRGGGKPHFVTGVVSREKAGKITDEIADFTLRLVL
jgi:alanyl-tRNA synthetase